MTGKAAVYAIVGFSLGIMGGAMGVRELNLPRTPAASQEPGAYAALGVFGTAFDTVRARYVDATDEQKLVTAAISGMVASLDPHSSFVPGKDLQALQSLYEGESYELGVEFKAQGGEITVARVIDGTSAASSGVQIGDVVVSIDGLSTQGMTIEAALAKTRGGAHSTVLLTAVRGAARQIEDFLVKRDVVKTQSVTARIEGGDIGYIRIGQFTERTADGVKAAFAAIGKAAPAGALKGYVLDLRGDPGGYVDQAIAIVNDFVDAGRIVSTQARNPRYRQVFAAAPGANLSRGKPLIVLIDGATASAAEIVAGALQDLKRARIVGMRSFGKGSMQSTIMLGSQGALRLTTAQYLLPSGRSIQARGIVPDIEVRPDLPADENAWAQTQGEASLPGHLANGGDEHSGSQAYVPSDPARDRQLIVAVSLLHAGDPHKSTVDTTHPLTAGQPH